MSPYNHEFSDQDAATMLQFLNSPRDRQPHICGWVVGGAPCNHVLLPEQFSGHLRAHGVTGDDKVKMCCLWVGCNSRMNKESVLRHVLEIHLEIKSQCPSCGMEFSRRDSMNKHLRSVHA